MTKSTCIKESIYLWAYLAFQRRVHFHHGKQAFGYGARKRSWEIYFDPQQSERERDWACHGLLKSQSLPPVIYFFQKDYIYSNKDTTPNPSNPFKQVTKHLNIWADIGHCFHITALSLVLWKESDLRPF